MLKPTVYDRKQEITHALLHGIGIIFGVSGLPVLAGMAMTHNNIPGIIGAGIYSFCFLLLFTCSTVYHITQEAALKKIFLVFDHISIYFLIAGTYTPFLLIYMYDAFGISLLSVLWGLTAVGILFKLKFTGKFDLISTLIYLVMGWIMVVGGRRFFDELPLSVMILLWVGGGLYTIGAFFYVWDRYRHTHAIWHAFVLGGALCHYVAVLLAM